MKTKTAILMLLMSAFSVLNAYSQLPSYVPTNGLVGYWPFNGNANDESGNGNNGTVNGTTLTADRNGVVNSAYSFDGTSNSINFSNTFIFNSNQNGTVSLWFNVNQISGGYSTLIFSRNTIGETSRYNFYLQPSGSTSRLAIDYREQNLTQHVLNETPFNYFNYNQWYNITIRRNGSTYDLFINGNYYNTVQDNMPNLPSSIGWIIGANPNNGQLYFKGKLDDISIYNRAISDQEISALYSGIPICSSPTSTITTESSNTFCQGGSVNLNASTGTNYTYQWYNNGNIINNATSNVYNATTSGDYTVKVTDGACNTTSSPISIVVNPIPNNEIILSGNNTFCQGSSVTLSAKGAGTYLWSNGSINQSITATQTGSYSVTVTNNGCNSTSSLTQITVNPLPTATITPQTNTTFCQGGSVNLNASTGTNYMYQWYNNGNTINNATSSVYTATTSGNYTVKVSDGACNATSSNQAVIVNANPSVSLNALNNVVFKTSLPIQLVGNPSGGTYSGDAVSGSVFTPANATLGKKTISYNYTTQEGCSGSASQTTIVTDSVGSVCGTYDTLKIEVYFTLGLNTNTTNTIKFYPNPTKDVLLIDNGNYQAMSGYSIKIVSLAGAVVYNQPITSQQVQISMNQFATKGLYIAQIVDSNNAIVDSKKIVLE